MSSTINDALEYYDRNGELYERIKKRITYIETYNPPNITTYKPHFNFYDNDKKLLFSSRVEIIGIVYNDHRMWVWGWAIPNLEYEVISTIRNVLIYGTTLDGSSNDIGLIKTELITSRYGLTDLIQIEIHCAIASYLAKIPFIFRIDNFNLDSGKIEKLAPYDDISGTSVYLYILDPPKDI